MKKSARGGGETGGHDAINVINREAINRDAMKVMEVINMIKMSQEVWEV